MSQELTTTNTFAMTNASWEEQLKGFKRVNDVINKLLQEGTDYGIVDGCGNAKILMKTGSEKLSRFFKFHVQYDISYDDLGDGHREYIVDTTAVFNGTDIVIGEGTGSCNTRESKYLYRKKGRKCPICSKEAITKGKKEYGGGWICFQKKGGCGAKFKDGDVEIERQTETLEEYKNPADYYNTCRKMAKKRAYVDCVITTLGIEMSQDLDTIIENIFSYNGANTTEDTGDYSEIKKAMEDKKIPREAFVKWLKRMYGADVDTALVLKTDAEKILDVVKNRPDEILFY